MIKHMTFAAIISLAFCFSACSNKADEKKEDELTTSDTTATTDAEQKEKEAAELVTAISLCESTLKENLNGAPKWVGEGKYYEGMEAKILKEEKDEKGKTQYKLRLNNGTEGWTSTWCWVEDAKYGVVTAPSIRLFKSADVVLSDIKVKMGQSVVVKQEKLGDYQEVIFEDENEKRKKGWLNQQQLQKVSFDSNVRLAAQFYQKIKTQEDMVKKEQLIDEFLSNTDFKSTPFYSKVESLQAPSGVDQYAEDEPLGEEGAMEEMDEELGY